MVVEERSYHVHTGRLAELVRIYEQEGSAVQQEILGGLIGSFTVDIGDLSTLVQLWGYASLDERAERRARLQADGRWKALLERITPLIHVQKSRILVPTSFSPIR